MLHYPLRVGKCSQSMRSAKFVFFAYKRFRLFYFEQDESFIILLNIHYQIPIINKAKKYRCLFFGRKAVVELLFVKVEIDPK